MNVKPSLKPSPRPAAPKATQAGGTGGSLRESAFPKQPKPKKEKQLGRALAKRTGTKAATKPNQAQAERKSMITQHLTQQNPLAGRKHLDDGGLAAALADRLNNPRQIGWRTPG